MRNTFTNLQAPWATGSSEGSGGVEFVEPRYKYRRWDGNDDKWAVAFDFAPGGAAEGQGSDDEAFVAARAEEHTPRR
ncbi:hypothetical protein V499_08341 [Pseudogymnoascus sp. VKM F-103]|nr:hypothetical protein V499_08341 [Pseudogymnoascus sp. VKM F-103]